MAYVAKQIPDDEQNQFGLKAPTTPFPQAQGGGSAGAGQGGVAPGVGTPTQFGSNAAKLSDYLSANKEQVGEMGGQIAGDLTNKYNQAKSGIDTGLEQFNQQVQGSYTPPSSTQLNQALNNSTEFAKDQKNVKDFQNWYNPQYQGPQNFEGSSTYSNLNNQVNQAVQNAGLTNTQSGLGTYMNQNMGANDSTEGMRLLDTALLQRDPNSAAAIKNAAKPYENLSGYLGDTTSKANQSIQSTKDQMQKSGEDVRNKFQQTTDAFQKDLNDRLAAGRSRESQEAETQKDILANGGYNRLGQFVHGGTQYGEPEIETALKDLGLSREELGNLLNNRQEATTGLQNPMPSQGYIVDPTNENILNYLTVSPSENMGIQNVASADDYSRAQALAALSNNPSLALPGEAAGPFNSVQFNKDALKKYQDIADEIKRQRLRLPSTPPPVTNPIGIGGSTNPWGAV